METITKIAAQTLDGYLFSAYPLSRTVVLTIGNTHLVSNPLGYLFCGENTAFKDSAVIEV